MRICVLASGSKGNSTFIEAGDVRVLIDHGITTKQLCLRLDQLGVAPESIDAVIVTHEHNDHVKGLPVWRKRFGTHLFINRATARNVRDLRRRDGPIIIFGTGEKFSIGELDVLSFPVSHDAADTVGLLLEWKGRRVGVATDLGQVTELVKARLEKLDALVIEANHDMDMLLNGPYPWPLKDRIRRKHGHLSNDQAADLIRQLAHRDLRSVTLAHISQENNKADLAMGCVAKCLECFSEVYVQPAWQDRIADPVNLV